MHKLFNPEGSDNLNERKLIGGNSTNLFNLNNVKYSWGNKLYRSMMENFWIPEKVSLTDDKVDYQKLTKEERRAYNGILSFLVFLDSIQTHNLPNVADFITAPEVKLPLMVQTYQEGIHSQSYAYIIESAIPKEEKEKIYNFWRTDKALLERNKYIASIYQDLLDQDQEELDEKSLKEYQAKVIMADYILEGIYFYNGFNFFYNLASRNMMTGTKDIIKYIHRDELTHCALFKQIIKTMQKEDKKFFDNEVVYDMFKKAVEHEIAWGQHIIGDNILGMSQNSIKGHTYWLANRRLKDIGLEEIFPAVSENPFRHLTKIADVNADASSKGNFFETTVTSYNQSSVFDDWNDLK